MIQALIGPIASLAGSWMESKVEQTKAKGRVAQAKAEADAAGDEEHQDEHRRYDDDVSD